MDKTKTSVRRRTSSLRTQKRSTNRQASRSYILKKNVEVSEYDPYDFILQGNHLTQAIVECLIDNDPDGVVDILEHYLNAFNKTELLQKAHIPRSTMYQLLRNRNPTIKTLAKLIHATQHT